MSDTEGQAADATALVATTSEVAAPTEKKVKRIIRVKKKRPARPQIDPALVKAEPPPQTGTTFNIWYNKWAGGDREDKYASKTAAKGRCHVARDSGYTRADQVAGSYFCLFFARGVCPKGQDCEYLHRLPTLHDLFNPNVDCFGRDKFSDYRDDMGGVGSFTRQNRTIYIGRIHVSDDIEEVVARHFAEWGQVERIRVLNTRGVAFVTYSNEANAQFAKEAMAHQSLDHNEILNVRWATADPNPMAQAREARRVEEQAAEAVRRALPPEFVAQLEGRDPDSWKRRRIDAPSGQEAAGGTGRGTELEHEERLIIEAAGSSSGGLPWETGGGAEDEMDEGIFSSRALAALDTARVTVSTQARQEAPLGPLVTYDSDSD